MNSRVKINPASCGGRPIIFRERVSPCKRSSSFSQAGDSIEEFLEAYPTLTRADVLALIQ